jgi:hypothetical protein
MKIAKFLRKVFGYKYILNTKTGEVHTDTATGNCTRNLSKDNKRYLSERQYQRIKYTYVNKHYVNGCMFCNKPTNKE